MFFCLDGFLPFYLRPRSFVNLLNCCTFVELFHTIPQLVDTSTFDRHSVSGYGNEGKVENVGCIGNDEIEIEMHLEERNVCWEVRITIMFGQNLNATMTIKSERASRALVNCQDLIHRVRYESHRIHADH
jgi:hypothetical protein